MTCVWDGLIKKLKIKNMDAYQFSSYVVKNNKYTLNILWNDTELTENQREENFQRIKKIKKIKNGYDCSSCDPLLLLICELYEVNMLHNFNGTQITYTNVKCQRKNPIHVTSNSKHFW